VFLKGFIIPSSIFSYLCKRIYIFLFTQVKRELEKSRMEKEPPVIRAAPRRGRSFLQLMLFLTVLGLGIVLMNPRVKDKMHHALINSGAYLPESVNNWMKSLHEPKPKKTPAEKDSKGNKVIGKSSHNWINGPSKLPHLKLFTLDDIKFVEGGKWYLVLIGHVFDVTGAEFYKPGSGYHAFIGWFKKKIDCTLVKTC
jgi:hypothetical protein